MAEVTEDMIGCLCYFGFRNIVGYWHLGVLKNIVKLKNCKKIYYINEFNEQYDKIKPVKLNEVKFYNHINNINKIDELISIFKNICLTAWTNNKSNCFTYDKEHAELKWTEIQLFFIKALEEWYNKK